MEFNTVSRGTQIAYKAEEADEVAQQTEVRGCASTVNAAVVQLKCASLSGEACGTCAPATESGGVSNGGDDAAGVSRRHSTDDLSGRPERKERASPRHESNPSVKPTGGEDEIGVADKANPQDELLEQILCSENMQRAWARVKANKGAAGADGMSISQASEFIRRNWEAIRSTLENGRYCPRPVRRVLIVMASRILKEARNVMRRRHYSIHILRSLPRRTFRRNSDIESKL